MNHDDRDLVAAFESLKTDPRSLPSVAQLTSSAARTHHRRRRMVRSVALVAVVVLPALMVYRSRAASPIDYERFTALTGIDLGDVTWKAPSDFLLDTPGDELLRTVPVIDIRIPIIPRDSVRPPDTNSTPALPRRSSHS